MTWAKELEELRRREALAEEMGGPDKVARQHGRGKMDARARIAALVDPGSFREIGKIAGKGSYDENGELTGVLPAPFLFTPPNFSGGSHAAADGAILAPMPGKVIAVDVTEGQVVAAGQRLLVLEAMKMEHALTAPFAGTVTELSVSQGSQVQVEAMLAVVEPTKAE